MTAYKRSSRRDAITWLCLFGPCQVFGENLGCVDLSLPTTPPDGACRPLSPSYAGFGIEASNLFSFMGWATRNRLTDNLLANLAKYAGAPAHIRIGGNAQDYMLYNASMTEWTWFENPHAQGPGHIKSDSIVYGPRFFEAANRLPAGTPVTWGLNLAYDGECYLDRLLTVAGLALDNTPNISITGFEIGNEPDLYKVNGFRDPACWSGKEYVKEWRDRAAALWENVLSPRNRTASFFEAAASATTIGNDFQISDLAAYGIDSIPPETDLPENSSFLSAWNQHDYYYAIGASSTPLTLSTLLRFETTEDQFSAYTTQIQQAHQTPHPYALREMGMVGLGIEGVTNTFGAALWTLNFLLYTASLGVAGVQFHMTDNSNGSAWQPVEMYERKPFVRPLYYGVAAFDQVIGDTDGSARVWQFPVSELSLPEVYAGRVRAYVVYESDAPSSVVVINGRVANCSIAECEKPRIDVNLQLESLLAGQEIHLAYLTGPGADATENTTWNGISYETSGDGTPTVAVDKDETVQIGSDGVVSFVVRDSQAVVGTIGRRTGSGSRCGSGGTSTSSGGGGDGTTTMIPPQEGSTTSPGPSASSSVPPAIPTATFKSSAMLLEVSLALTIGVLLL